MDFQDQKNDVEIRRLGHNGSTESQELSSYVFFDVLLHTIETFPGIFSLCHKSF